MPILNSLPPLFQQPLPLIAAASDALSKARHQFEAVAARVTLPRRQSRDFALFQQTASGGNFEQMKRIVDTYPEAVTWQDKSGKTLLHHAAIWNNPAMAAYYLDKGADIAAKDNQGYRALHDAAQCAPHEPGQDPTATLRLLLARGAKLEVRNVRGETPLRYAVERNKPWNVRALILAGAQTLASDLRGETPVSYAKKFPTGEMSHAIDTAYEELRNRWIAEGEAKRAAEIQARVDAAGKAVTQGTQRPIKALRRVTFKA